MNRLLGFYYGSHPDNRGRLLADIIEQSDVWLEATHDFIQWLFPLCETSRVVPSAPLADKEVIKAFHQDEILRDHLLASYTRMLRFYGLVRNNGRVTKGDNWEDRKANWFTTGTHNDLRITRIIKSLSILGLSGEAATFLACLEELVRTEPGCGIGETALRHWRNALHG